MSSIPADPVRTCPWPDCRAVWVEDPVMYEDTDRCPHCGRYADAYEYPPDSDVLSSLPGGSSLHRQRIYTETAGPLLQENGQWLVTQHSIADAQYRR